MLNLAQSMYTKLDIWVLYTYNRFEGTIIPISFYMGMIVAKMSQIYIFPSKSTTLIIRISTKY